MPDPAYTPLTPLAFLGRSAAVFPDKVAVVSPARRLTYRELADEAMRVAQGLRACGVRPGDRVAYLSPNLPELLIGHFAVPLAGAVLVAVNIRLSPAEISYILDHSGSTVLVVHASLLGSVRPVLDRLATVRHVVVVDGKLGDADAGHDYTDLLAYGSEPELPWAVADENAVIAVNYTSGTTGRPKGVMYTHRGAYLNALGETVHSRHTPDSVYLWTLPMFHCSGWCTTWAVTALGATHVCLPAVDGDEIWRLIDAEGVTHFNAAPTVLLTVLTSPRAHRLDRGVTVMRGNNVMAGYYRDEQATAEAFRGGWLHSGDLGVMHPDGYVELRDRAKDVIVSGGENISTVEVEQAIVSHPSVLETAVVGVPDEQWGERPKAFVVLRSGHEVSAADLVSHVRDRIARYKTPREVEFVAALPKTSTGKVQKFELREKEWAGHERRISG